MLGCFGDKLNERGDLAGNMDKFTLEGTVGHRRNGAIYVESRLVDWQNPSSISFDQIKDHQVQSSVVVLGKTSQYSDLFLVLLDMVFHL